MCLRRSRAPRNPQRTARPCNRRRCRCRRGAPAPRRPSRGTWPCRTPWRAPHARPSACLRHAAALAARHTLLRVFERRLISAHRASRRHPRYGVARYLQHLGGVAERIAALDAVRFRHPNVLQRDVTVLHDLERNLVLDLLDTEAGGRLVLDDEALDLVVGDIARPDD